MKAPLSWLRDFAPIGGKPLDLADRLNSIGLIVEGIHAPGRDIAGVRTVSEAAILAPNTFFSEFTARKLSNARFRGISSSPANPGITTYIDGVPQFSTHTSNIEFMDVDNVEFVRGPQSALFGRNTLGGLVHILLILLIAVFSWTLMASIIEHRLALELSNGVRPSARERTLLTLFRNVLAIVISTITVMIVLSQVGLNIAPLLAGAGALGLAISFGAQTLVKDVITGVFIQFENGMNTGEYVTVSGITGTVERMTIRSIGLRDDYGVYHIVPYSSITTLANYAREFGVYRANYTVSRDEDIDRVNEVLHQAIEALKQDEQVKHFLIGEPAFNGVVALGDRSFTTRVTVRTQALKQWVVQYALDRLVKIHFDRAGIGMPQQAMQISRAPQPHDEQAPPAAI